MKLIAILAAAAFATPAFAQEIPCEKQSDCWNGGKDARPWPGYNCGVRWERSLEGARERAAKERKPILLFQLVGELDKEGCWAAGDIMRTVTFSDPRVADFIKRNFVAAWINRGAGFHNEDYQTEGWIYESAMEAYPTKNICTFFLAPDGRVFHYVAGSYGPEFFLDCLRTAVGLRSKAFDAGMNLREGGLEALAEGHRDAAEQFTGKDLGVAGNFATYRGYRHTHGDACRNALTEGRRYLSALHRHWAERRDLPRFEDVRSDYLWGNSFTEETRGTDRVQGRKVGN